jgi:hypothetical protein
VRQNKILRQYKMSSTNYLNSKHRRIFQGKTGGFYAQAEGGAKVYGPKAMYRKVGGEGAVRRIAAHNLVPNKIRSMKFRKSTMKAPGTKRATRAKMSPVYNLPNPYLRRVRKNKGVKRVAARSPKAKSPRARKVSTRIFKKSNPYDALMRSISA